MHHHHKVELGTSQIWMDSIPTAFYVPENVIKLLLNQNEMDGIPADILNSCDLPCTCIESGNHKYTN